MSRSWSASQLRRARDGAFRAGYVSFPKIGRAGVGDKDVHEYADQIAENATRRWAHSEQRWNGAQAHQVADGRSGREAYDREGQTQ